MSRPLTVHIDCSALRHNHALMQARAKPAKMLAVVKANAYGHGLTTVVEALQDQAHGFALIEFEWARDLRRFGVTHPILLLEGVFNVQELYEASRQSFMIAVYSPVVLEWIEREDLPRPVHLFLKFNSGMHRLGFALKDVNTLIARLMACRNVAHITLMTHFALSDPTIASVQRQQACFASLTPPCPVSTSLSSSAVLLRQPRLNEDWARCGIALYGATGSIYPAATFGLKAVMTLRSKIIALQEVAKGGYVGYGKSFIATNPMRIGVVACGYADGYPYHASTQTPVLVGNTPCRLVGRVSMDMLTVDLTSVPHAGIGTDVELWGRHLPIDQIASAANTLSYELMCQLAPRVPKTVHAPRGI